MQRLNSDGQQFYQYKQNEHTPPILTEVTENKNKDHNAWRWIYKTWLEAGTKVCVWGGGLNLLVESAGMLNKIWKLNIH